jgi:hypothetical protein
MCWMLEDQCNNVINVKIAQFLLFTVRNIHIILRQEPELRYIERGICLERLNDLFLKGSCLDP